MIDKLPARCRTALLTGALALLAASPFAVAQDTASGATAEEGRLIVPLSGTAMLRRNGNLTASPARVDTGLIEIGDYKPIAITLTHTGGDEPITIGEAVLIGRNAAEYVTEFGGFRTLVSGESAEVQVTFTPTSPGVKSAGLKLDIDGASAPYVILFDGRSRFPLTSDLDISTTKLAFGQTAPGESATGTFELTNLGDAEAPSITVNGIELGGDTPEVFGVQFVPTTLDPGDTLEVPATMSSSDAGTKSADVLIYHDGNNPAVETRFEGEVVSPVAIPVNFGTSDLKVSGIDVKQVTSIKFGPDGKLYYSEMNGPIHVLSVQRKGKNDYEATRLETIDLVRTVLNHDDDGTPNPHLGKRLVTGMIATGSAAQPVLYVASSDPRQGGGPPKASHGPTGGDTNLDTNSGMLHKLTKTGGGWVKQDIVRGLPRSEENHAPNGMVKIGDKILLVTGGHTNMGLPSYNFAQLPEFALSAAILEIDLGQIGNGTHDLPTLDDEDRAGANDANDPFGGNNGKNQAKLVANGPVELYATGFRNAFDLVMTDNGKLYTFDNGPNNNWGGKPANNCKNAVDDGGSKHSDSLHLVTRGSHAGHPNPTRGNKENTYNDSNPQSPVEIAERPVECQHKGPDQDGSLTSIDASTNGLVEYDASNFGFAMKGDLVAVGFNETIYRVVLNDAGNAVTSKSSLATKIGKSPLSVTAQGDADPFPGTIWVGHHGAGKITVLEPSDY